MVRRRGSNKRKQEEVKFKLKAKWEKKQVFQPHGEKGIPNLSTALGSKARRGTCNGGRNTQPSRPKQRTD